MWGSGAGALALVLASLPGCSSRDELVPEQRPAQQVGTLEPAAAAAPVAPARQVLVAEHSSAHFDDDRLTDCWTTTVALSAPRAWARPQPSITLEQASWLLLDEAILLAGGGQTVLPDARGVLSGNLLAVVAREPEVFLESYRAMSERAKERAPKNAKRRSDWINPESELERAMDANIQVYLSALHWPPAHLAKEFEDGTLVDLESCSVPNRQPLGVCEMMGPGKQTATLNLQWSIRRVHFDARQTDDTDAALKSCLRLGGHWFAPAQNDPAAARERLRQRVAELKTTLEAL